MVTFSTTSETLQTAGLSGSQPESSRDVRVLEPEQSKAMGAGRQQEDTDPGLLTAHQRPSAEQDVAGAPTRQRSWQLSM